MTDRVRAIAWGMAALGPAIACTPAGATVSFVQAGAYSQTHVGIAGPDTVKHGPSDESTDYGDGYFASTSDSREDYRFSQARSSSAGAIQFANPASAEFFVRTSSIADTLPNEDVPRAGAAGSTLYYFSLDTASTLTFTAFASPDTPGSDASVEIDLFSVGSPGLPGTIYRQGTFGGSGTFSFDLVAGLYGFEVDAFSSSTSFGTRATPSSVANVSLSIDSPPLPPPPVADVPEPASWAMMVSGFGLVGATARRRPKKPIAVTFGSGF